MNGHLREWCCIHSDLASFLPPTGNVTSFGRKWRISWLPWSMPVFVQEQSVFNHALFSTAPHAVYITCLRDPVERVISAYCFEGRWRHSDLTRSENTAVSLETWLDRQFVAARRRIEQHRSRLRLEVRDYYTQIFSGTIAFPVTRDHFETAVKALVGFDAVLILERLQTNSGRREASQLLHKVLALPVVDTNDRCAPWIYDGTVNAGVVRLRKNITITTAQREWIELNNFWDRQVYNKAVSIYEDLLHQHLRAPGLAQHTCQNHDTSLDVLCSSMNMEGDSIEEKCWQYERRSSANLDCTTTSPLLL